MVEYLISAYLSLSYLSYLAALPQLVSLVLFP